MPFSYSTTYILDKSHYLETFDESRTAIPSSSAYLKSVILLGLGLMLLLFTQFNPYVGWFLVGLAGVEALSVRFQRSWWLGRQLISRAANNELTLTIDEHGISCQSDAVQMQILWADIEKVEKTQRGWLLSHPGGKYYLSDRCLSEKAGQFISSKAVSTPQ
ncbi:YcxB family protein [Bowmanella dokdonensis]|nr:YcxB family protein [Bowmanella dokdonensis]